MSLFDDQLHGEKAPPGLQDFLNLHGGKTPQGHPRYRLVWAPSVRHKSYGTFYDWHEDTPVNERGGLEMDSEGTWGQVSNRPIRVVTEMRWVETYPDIEGWIVERWYPRHMFGDPAAWEKNRLLGPYPEAGMYVDCCNPMSRVPSVKLLENLVSAIEYKIANKQGTMEQRVAKRVAEIQANKEKQRLAARSVVTSKLHEVTPIIFGSSLAAGRIRESIANRIRARGGKISHVGN